jgi:magnesium transporter
MKNCFQIKNGSIVPAGDGEAGIHVYASPDEKEKQEILDTLRLDPHDLESALDPDEISRIEYTPERISVIWKRPKNASFEHQLRFDVSSVGLFLHQNRLTMVMREDVFPLSAKEFQNVSSLNDIFLRFFLHTVHHYLGHLKVIKQITVDLESKISTSMENRYLVQMFALGESLIYYLNAIEANGTVLSKLRSGSERFGFSKEQIESLDDILLDNQQCARQAQIYSTVLTGLMDARGNLINNNMNVLLKNLTIINIIFLPLNLIAGIGGMSEFSMMTQGIDWKLTYGLFSLAMVVIGWLTWIILIRSINKTQRPRRRKGLFKWLR